MSTNDQSQRSDKPGRPDMGLRRLLGLWGGPLLALACLVTMYFSPKFTADPFQLSFVVSVMILLLGALHVWLLLRMNLFSFAAPAFMSIGGYTSALVALHLTTNGVIVATLAFLVPAGVAGLIGAVVLRLKGTYFALLTFVLAQVVTLVIIIARGPLGGNDGLTGVPALTVAGNEVGSAGPLVRFSAAVGIVGLLAAILTMMRLRRQFTAIRLNEGLAASLGLVPWRYKLYGFVVASGVGGLAGMVLVNKVAIAHPDEFTAFSSVNYVAAAVVGGAPYLGPVVGSVLLTWLDSRFATQGMYSQIFLGAALIMVVLFFRDGIAGVLVRLGRAALRSVSHTGDPNVEPTIETTRPRSGSSTLADAKDAVEFTPVPTGRSTAREREAADAVGPMLVARGLTRRYSGVVAVQDASLTVAAGEVVGVIGPNGAGKTTLVNLLCGQVRPNAGSITFGGHSLTGCSPQRISNRGLVRSFQHTSVFTELSVRENVMSARTFSRRAITDEEVAELLEIAALSRLLDAAAGDLPYGHRKLLGLVLVLVTAPRLVLLDEPAAGLETDERLRIDRLVAWALDRNCGILLIEHDMDLVRRLCSRAIGMDGGQVIAEGTPQEVLSEPRVLSSYLGVEDLDQVDDEWDAPRVRGSQPGSESHA